MTVISFFERDGMTSGVRARGHSGYAESGRDIVCAAASALVQTAYLAIEDLGAKVAFERDDDNAFFEFRVERDARCDHDVQVILRALRVGVNDLRDGYPEYVRTETITGGK